MYFIINKTKNSITFNDINNIVLGPRQAIDLDKTNIRREIVENSKTLKAAKNRGDIEIRTDEKKNKDIPIQTINSSNTDINKVKDEIIKEIKELKKEDPNKENFSKEDIISIFKELISALPKERIIEKTVSVDNNKVEKIEEEIEKDEKLLSEMNVRAVNKITKNTKTEFVDYKEEKQKNDLLDNISELENLIG